MSNDVQGFFERLRERGWLAPILQSLVVLTVWVLVAYLTIRLLSDDDSNDSNSAPPVATAGQVTTPTESTPSPTSVESTTDGESPPTSVLGTSATSAASDVASAIAACQGRWAAQGRPLNTIHEAMGQWRLHIQAMNRLVSGQITLDQATQFWLQSEKGAKANIRRFQEDDLTYSHEAPLCKKPASSVFDADPDPTLTTCMEAVRASDRVLRAGRISIETWEHHVHDMDSLMAGLITPDQATAAWTANWHKGNRQLGRYDAKRDRSLRFQCE